MDSQELGERRGRGDGGKEIERAEEKGGGSVEEGGEEEEAMEGRSSESERGEEEVVVREEEEEEELDEDHDISRHPVMSEEVRLTGLELPVLLYKGLPVSTAVEL